MPSWTLRHSRFPEVIRETYDALCAHDSPVDALHRLRLFKCATVQTSSEIQRMFRFTLACCVEDRLGCTIGCLHPVETRRQRAQRLASCYPSLTDLCPLSQVMGGESARLGQVRDHVIELSRLDIDARVAELKAPKHELPEFEERSRKAGILKRLKQLTPGCCTGLPAICDPAGQVSAIPNQMAEFLSQHWG